MKKKLIHHFTGSISRQITAIYISLSLIILAGLAAVISLFIHKVFLSNYVTAVNNALTTTANELSYTLTNIDLSVSTLTTYNETFFTSVTTDYHTVKDGQVLYDSIKDMVKDSLDFITTDTSANINTILFLDDELPLTHFFINFSSPRPLTSISPNEKLLLSSEVFLRDQPWLTQVMEQDGDFYWFTDKTSGLLYGAKTLTHTELITVTDITSTNIGILLIMFDAQAFLDQIQSTITGTQNSVVTLKLTDSELQLNALHKQKYYKHEVTLPIGFSVVIQTPEQDLSRLSFSYTYLLLLLTVVILLSTVLLARYLSLMVTRPIVKLSQHMENSPALAPIDTGNLPDNEIKNIYETYNNMLIRIDKLITEKEIETEKRKEQEFATYQLQINPHFLYNTLNTLSCYMMLKEDSTMVEALNILANHLRYNYKEPNAEVPISEELTQLRNYVQIQNIRYKNKINLQITVPDEHMHLAVCKMILQPLVENAINYELGRFDDFMVIRIFSYTEDNRLKLCVANDLVCEDVEQINDHIAGKINISSHSGGLGTRNINDRLILKYGPDYGLQFKTSDTETIACLTLPMRST